MTLMAGAATRDITPAMPVFLAGYPHAARVSTGAHDPLLASAIHLSDGRTPLLLIGLDILYISQQSTAICREAINKSIGIPAGNILISATHTHSGPVTADQLAWRNDPAVPAPDPGYMEHLHNGIIGAGIAAHTAAQPAEIAITSASAEGIGRNRLDPKGPFDPEVGLLAVRSKSDSRLYALDIIYGMHPTVIHEDTKLASSDFPHYTRQHIIEKHPGITPVYHNGPCGNLSPRYDVKGQTFTEAERLGRKLGKLIVKSLKALKDSDFSSNIPLVVKSRKIKLTPNKFPPVPEAEARLRAARDRFEQLKRERAPRGAFRTAECVVFGAENALALTQAQAAGELARRQAEYAKAEVQVLRIGDAFLAGLPGEIFVEYALEIKQRAPKRAFVIGLANGELQGYIVTPAAARAGGYEAAWAMFAPESGRRMVKAALNLIDKMKEE
ncbi:MAG: neutral/alkaline non-lysosomal ceramidase N-terminal domain-containing protein [Kiritimatiellia bacterium]